MQDACEESAMRWPFCLSSSCVVTSRSLCNNHTTQSSIITMTYVHHITSLQSPAPSFNDHISTQTQASRFLLGLLLTLIPEDYLCLQCFDAVGWAAVNNWVLGCGHGYLLVVPEKGPLNGCVCVCITYEDNAHRILQAGRPSHGNSYAHIVGMPPDDHDVLPVMQTAMHTGPI